MLSIKTKATQFDLIEKAMHLPWLSPAAKCVLISAIIGGFEEYSLNELDVIMQCTVNDIDVGLRELACPIDKSRNNLGVTTRINQSKDLNKLILSEEWR